MTRTPDRRRFPPCGRVFDGETCRKRGEHLCAPRAAHAVAFFAELLVHTKGDYSRRPFILADWERTEIVEPLIGTVEFDPVRLRYVRRYRELYLSTGRKNGKTEIVAGLMLYLLIADDEDGAELYGLALDKDQAALAFNVAARMVALSPVLAHRLGVLRAARRIVDEQTASFWAVTAGDAMGSLGADPHAAYIDELLAQPSRELYDALRTGFGTRAQPLMILTTTADNDPTGFAASERAWSEKVVDDPELDHGRLVVLHAVPRDADWRDERTWYLANPALGDYLSLATLRGEYVKTISNPAAERAFRQYRCNQQGSRAGRAVDLPTWDAAPRGPDLAELAGRTCYAGLDLASTIDLASYCLDFPARRRRARRDLAGVHPRGAARGSRSAHGRQGVGVGRVRRADPHRWRRDRLWRDRRRAERRPRAVRHSRGRVRPLGRNPAQYVADRRRLAARADGQGFATMSGPTKELLRLVAAKTYRHGHNPVVRWQADNLVTRTDPAGNIKPDKSRSADKIDSLVAAIMALDRAITARRRAATRVRRGRVLKGASMTDIDQLNRLREAAAAKLTIQAARATAFQRYYDNEAGIVAMLSQPDRQVFKTFLDESSANWCELVVSAVSQRLQVVGFRFDDDAASDAAWEIWQANQLDADAELAQTVALTTGSAFALVQPDDDNPTGVGISIESPLQATVLYEPGDRRKRAAGFKTYAADYDWLITGQSALGPYGSSVLAQGAGNAVEILITPDEIVTWYPGDDRDKPLIEPNPTGVVSLVELVPQPALLRPPRSELESAMPIQDRINTTIFARMVATDFGAFRTITATGVKIARNVIKSDDGTEAVEVVRPFDIGANRLLASEDPASKFGSIALTRWRAIWPRASRTYTPSPRSPRPRVLLSGDAHGEPGRRRDQGRRVRSRRQDRPPRAAPGRGLGGSRADRARHRRQRRRDGSVSRDDLGRL